MTLALGLLKTAGWVVLLAPGNGIATGFRGQVRDVRNAQVAWDALQDQPFPASGGGEKWLTFTSDVVLW